MRDMYAFFFLFCFILSRLLSLLGGDFLLFTRFNCKRRKKTKVLTSDAKPPLFAGRRLFLFVVVLVLLAFDNFNNDEA